MNNQISLLDEIDRKKILENGLEDFEKEMDRISALSEEKRDKLFKRKEENGKSIG